MPRKTETEIETGSEEAPERAEEGEKPKGERPAFRVVQAERDANGESRYRSVGGMWRRVSKNGKEFYSLGIGNLRLLVFPNEGAE